MKKRGIRSKPDIKRRKPQTINLGEAIVLDFYPHGRSLSHKRSEDFNPVAITITTTWFQLFEVIFAPGAIFAVNDHFLLSTKNRRVIRFKKIRFSDLSSTILEILPEVIVEIVKNHESRYISFLNQAHPLTTQMHQLQLLHGIGNKRMWTILEARRKSHFSSFKDFSEKTGISDPISLFSNRILLELEESQKYHLFTKKLNEQG
jgi:putative nucleotide binding protein